MSLVENFGVQVDIGARVDGKEDGKASALDGQVEEGVEDEHLGDHLAASGCVHGAKGCH